MLLLMEEEKEEEEEEDDDKKFGKSRNCLQSRLSVYLIAHLHLMEYSTREGACVYINTVFVN